VIALFLALGCSTPEKSAPAPEPAHHAVASVDAGTWLVGGEGLAYEAQPRHHAVHGNRVALARADGGVEIWREGDLVKTVPSDCETSQCPVPQVGFVDGELVIVRPRVGALPTVIRGDAAVEMSAPEPWDRQAYSWFIPKKWGVERRPLVVDVAGIWTLPGKDDDVLAISPDRAWLAWSDWRGAVHVGEPSDTPTMSWPATPGGATRILELAWSPESDRIVALGAGQAIQVFHPESPKRISGGPVVGAPQGLVLIDSMHAIGWNGLGIACLGLNPLQILATWNPGTVRQAQIASDGRSAAISGAVSGVASIDIEVLCGLDR